MVTKTCRDNEKNKMETHTLGWFILKIDKSNLSEW